MRIRADVKQVLFVSHAAGSGGAENFLGLLLAGLDRARYQPCVLSRRRAFPIARPAGLESAARRLGVEFRFVDLKWWARDWRHDAAFARGLADRVKAIAAAIRNKRPALVVTNTSAVVEGALAARQCGVPHVWYIHEMLSRDPGLAPFLPLADFYGLMQSLSARLIVVSDAVRAEIEAFAPSEKITVLHTGIPSVPPSRLAHAKRELFDLADDEPLVAFVGRLSRRKGVLDLLEAAGQVLVRRPKVCVILAGANGGMERELSARIRQLGLNNRVRLLGPRGDVPDILAAADLLVLPALADPLPLAVLEAMSVGKPVVATRSGGCEEMVVDGQTGFLTPVADPAALAAAIERLVDDPARRLAMGQAGKVRFDAHFDQRRYLESLMAVWDEAATQSPAPQEIGPIVCRLIDAARQRRAAAWRAAPRRERLLAVALDWAYRCGAVR